MAEFTAVFYNPVEGAEASLVIRADNVDAAALFADALVENTNFDLLSCDDEL